KTWDLRRDERQWARCADSGHWSSRVDGSDRSKRESLLDDQNEDRMPPRLGPPLMEQGAALSFHQIGGFEVSAEAPTTKDSCEPEILGCRAYTLPLLCTGSGRRPAVRVPARLRVRLSRDSRRSA